MIYYFCRVNSEFDRDRFGSGIHIGPAYQKIINICRAFGVAGVSVSVVSVPVCNELGVRSSSLVWRKGTVRDVSLISLGTITSVIFARIYASFAFLLFSVRNVGVNDQVILYNFFPEYIFSSIWLMLRGRKALLDIEDAPRVDETGLRGFVNRLSFRVLKYFCARKTITVSHRVAQDLKLSDYHVLYGALPSNNFENVKIDALLCAGDAADLPVNFIYGGALMKETGVDVFNQAIQNLCLLNISPRRPVCVYVSGHGSLECFADSKYKLPDWLRLVDCRNMLYEDYVDLLAKCHVGLCLKLPGTSIGDTTFPSKVVEILSSGLLLISTPVSDVPILFSAENSVILEEPYPSSLSAAIFKIADDASSYSSIANNGILTARRIFSQKAVGTGFRKWLQI